MVIFVENGEGYDGGQKIEALISDRDLSRSIFLWILSWISKYIAGAAGQTIFNANCRFINIRNILECTNGSSSTLKQ